MEFLEQAEQVLKVVALLGALLFFAFKLGNGYYVPSMSVMPQVRRVRDSAEADLLVIDVRLRVGSVSTVELHAIEARVTIYTEAGNRQLEPITFPGTGRVGTFVTEAGGLAAVWNQGKRLRLRQSEEPTFSALQRIPAGSVCLVEVAAIARRAWVGRVPCVWKTTVHSLPGVA